SSHMKNLNEDNRNDRKRPLSGSARLKNWFSRSLAKNSCVWSRASSGESPRRRAYAYRGYQYVSHKDSRAERRSGRPRSPEAATNDQRVVGKSAGPELACMVWPTIVP